MDVRVVDWLRQLGHDATHLREEGLQQLPDPEVFAKGRAEDRIVVTFDLDFGEIAAFAREGRPSVILFRLRNTRRTHVIERLRAVLAEAEADLVQGAVVLVEESRLRIRALPLGKKPKPELE